MTGGEDWDASAAPWLRRIALGMAMVAAMLAGRWLVPAARRGERESAAAHGLAPSISAEWPAAPRFSLADWGALRAPAGGGPPPSPTAPADPVQGRYRLAGTLLMRDDDCPNSPARYGRAVIDDLAERRQHLLAEWETAGSLRVVRIELDRVTAEIDGRPVVLTMDFGAGPTSGGTPADPVVAAAAGMAAIETNRFGRRVREDRWLIERAKVMEYYRELRDDPARIARLYETFRPLREEGRIAGYQIDILGEREFLEAVGLRQGDVVRAVNSMKMTSRSRAEFFIGEFLKEQLNAVVLEVERDGRPQRLVYLIR